MPWTFSFSLHSIQKEKRGGHGGRKGHGENLFKAIIQFKSVQELFLCDLRSLRNLCVFFSSTQLKI